MIRTRAVLAGAVLTLVALVGCAGGNTEPGAEPSNPATADVEAVPTPTTEPEPTPTETPLGETSQRGNLIKAIGDTACMYETDPANPWLEFQITGRHLGANAPRSTPRHQRTASSCSWTSRCRRRRMAGRHGGHAAGLQSKRLHDRRARRVDRA